MFKPDDCKVLIAMILTLNIFVERFGFLNELHACLMKFVSIISMML